LEPNVGDLTNENVPKLLVDDAVGVIWLPNLNREEN